MVRRLLSLLAAGEEFFVEGTEHGTPVHPRPIGAPTIFYDLKLPQSALAQNYLIATRAPEAANSYTCTPVADPDQPMRRYHAAVQYHRLPDDQYARFADTPRSGWTMIGFLGQIPPDESDRLFG